MKNVNLNYNQLNNKKKAFTLIELLIVIAIIGILFIVLVSKVDFATDKAKASGVQTDFRSFQMALDTVAKENAGFNTFGWDTGDIKRADFATALAGYTYTNEDKDRGDGIRNSYDKGDKNLNGKQDVNGKDGYTGTTETFTGTKVYTEMWTDVWTLVKPGTTGYDADAIFALESAINKNLDPKLHITINAADGTIAMANQARDPWKNEYHGYYITNASADKGDRGAIVMYSDGANGKFCSLHTIEKGVVTVTVPGNNVDGKDDYALGVFYTFANGFGEVAVITNGFSSNQAFNPSGNLNLSTDSNVNMTLEGHGQKFYSKAPADLTFRSHEPLSELVEVRINGTVLDESLYSKTEGSTIIGLPTEYLSTLAPGTYRIDIVSENNTVSGTFDIVEQGMNNQHFYYDVPYMMGTLDENGELHLDAPIGIMMWADGTIYCCAYESVDYFPVWKYRYTVSGDVITVHTDGDNSLVPDGLTGTISEDGKNVYFDGYGNFAMSTECAMSEGEYFYAYAWWYMGPFVLDKTQEAYQMPLYNMNGNNLPFAGTFRDCVNLKAIELPIGCTNIGTECFQNCTSMTTVVIPVTVTQIDGSAFDNCTSLTTIRYSGTMAQWNKISKNSSWCQDIPATEVICSDGVVTIK